VPAQSSGARQPPSTPSPAPAASGAVEGVNYNDPSRLALGPQADAAVANMLSMGFQRAEIDRAMRAAFFNPDRAVEYLLNVRYASTLLSV
jgi:UV excision repair protein RAD23